MATRIGSSNVALPALTGLRGVAAAWVVLFHMQVSFEPPAAIPAMGRALLGHGWVAVDLFFILSGFVLMHGHGREFRSIRANAVKRFFLQRILRIYPTSTVVLLLVLGLTLVDPGFAADRRSHLPEDFTFASFLTTLALATRWTASPGGDWNLPVWSLSVEIIGYVAFPWIARAAGLVATRRAAVSLGLGSILLLTAASAISGRTDFNDYGPYGLSRMGAGFVCGAYLAQAFHLAPQLSTRRASGLAFAAAAALCLACAVPTFMVLAPISSAVLVFALAFGGGGVARCLSARPLLWLGRISFPLYLVHMVPITWIAYRVMIAGASASALCEMLVAYLATCLVVAYLLHILVERPTHRLARRLVLRRVPLAPAPPSVERCTA